MPTLIPSRRVTRLLVVGSQIPDDVQHAGEIRLLEIPAASLPMGIYLFERGTATDLMSVSSGGRPATPARGEPGTLKALDAALASMESWWTDAIMMSRPLFNINDPAMTRGTGQEAQIRSRDYDQGHWWYRVRVDGRTVSLPERGLRLERLVLDEAHRVRRSEAAVTAAVRRIRAGSLWALSGAPIERDTEDLSTLLSILTPQKYSASTHLLGDEVIRSFAEPFVLRRRKEDVLEELPAVDEQSHTLDLLPAQRQSYQHATTAALKSTENTAALLQLIGELLTICDYDPESEQGSKCSRFPSRSRVYEI